MVVGVGQRSQLVFMSVVCYVIVLNVFLSRVLTAGARSVVAVEGSTDQSREPETCMTRWLRRATVNSSDTIPPSVSESILKGLLLQSSKPSASLADVRHISIATALGGDQNAARYLQQCFRSSQSSFECVRDTPCLNGGQCVFQTTPRMSRDFMCQCAPGYTGQFCATEIPECRQVVCGEGATCKPTRDGYVCLCPPLRTGRHCQTTWFSPDSLSNVVSSIHQVANRQSVLQKYVKNVANATAAQVANFLSKLERKMEQSFEVRFSSVRSSVANEAAARLQKFEASFRQAVSSLQSSVDSVKSTFTATFKQLLALNSTVQQHLLTDTSHTSHPHTTRQLRQTAYPSTTPATTPASIHAHSGSSFDPQKKGRLIMLTPNGREADASGGLQHGAVLSRTGYTTRTYQWKLLVSIVGPQMGIGVTTVPYEDSAYESYGSPTGYAWWNDRANRGLAASQTRTTARLSAWRSGDRLTVTLDCDQQLLTMRLHRTNEEKTIRMNRHGQPLYLYVYLWKSKVQILN